MIPLFLIMSCTKKVARVDVDSTIDLSGRWNDADSRMVAEEMIHDCLSQRWLYKYDEEKRRPTVIVGRVRNKSHEHINVKTFVKDMERVLLNSARVDFVASKEERDQIREEKADQAEHATVYTAKSMGEETGAELMLIGSINTIFDQEDTRAVLYYQVDMELIEIETNKKVWIGDKKIKKYVTRSRTKF
jgi:PBP1b-binding outer membrane lipoprotein LpoB